MLLRVVVLESLLDVSRRNALAFEFQEQKSRRALSAVQLVLELAVAVMEEQRLLVEQPAARPASLAEKSIALAAVDYPPRFSRVALSPAPTPHSLAA